MCWERILLTGIFGTPEFVFWFFGCVIRAHRQHQHRGGSRAQRGAGYALDPVSEINQGGLPTAPIWPSLFASLACLTSCPAWTVTIQSGPTVTLTAVEAQLSQ